MAIAKSKKIKPVLVAEVTTQEVQNVLSSEEADAIRAQLTRKLYALTAGGTGNSEEFESVRLELAALG